MAKLISKTYGDALLEIAKEEKKLDIFAEEITAIVDILSDNPDFGKLMNNPRIAIDDKIDVLKNVFESKISDEILGFFSMIISKGRYAQIDEILEYFLTEVKKLKGVGVAYIKTPIELKDAQKKAIEKKLLDTTSYRQMEMHYLIDKSLIGGMQIRIGDRVVDSSILTKINKLQQAMMKASI